MPAGKPSTPLCDQFGFNAEWREAQLLLIGLDEYPGELLKQLHEQVLQHDTIAAIVDRFYEQLLRNEQAAALLSSFDLEHLKERQVTHFRDFGLCCRDAGYFEARARVGIVHARIGLPLSLYLAAFGVMQALILEAIANHVADERQWQHLSRLVMKLITLDIALATEVYHRAQIRDMDRSLKHLETQQKALREQLEQDELTGVSSRTSLLRELQRAIARALKTGQPLCVIMADLDHFKSVNDSHGHITGDQVLKEVAARIKAALREFDLVGRYGGEEFVILLEDTSHHTAQQIAERIRQRIASQPIQVGGKSLQLTISQGLAVCRDSDDSQTLLERADEAMYQAKRNGRNCVAEENGHAAGR